MQILDVVIYSYHGDSRSIPLKPKKVNIIVGPSGTGKSAIGRIIEYCLGRGEFMIPSPGPMDDRVEWYGIRGQIGNEQFFVARKNPRSIDTVYATYFKIGNEIDVPKEIKRPTTSIKEVARTLSGRLGIIPSLKLPWPNYLRPQQVSIKESLAFCFQYQDEVQSTKTLFHYGREDYWDQILRNTLPYFLGAVSDDKARFNFDLLQIERELNVLKNKIDEADVIKGKGVIRARQILTEAKSAGLISEDESPKTIEEYVLALKRIATWTPAEMFLKGRNNLDKLQENSIKLRNQLIELDKEIDIVTSYRLDFTSYENDIKQQKSRLRSFHLFEELNGESEICPLCSKKLDETLPIIEVVKNSIKDLTVKLKDVSSETSTFDIVLDDLKKKKETLEEQLEENYEDIKAILSQHKDIREKYDDNMRRARISAKAAFWLDSVNTIQDEELYQKIQEKNYLKDRISEEINPVLVLNNVKPILSGIDNTINEWARTLKLELSEYTVGLNPETFRLELKNQNSTSKITTSAGENWMGYHLITQMALHRYFNKKNRPVPNFLFFDQPSQVYFSTEKKDWDYNKVNNLYNFIFEIEDQNALQMIIVDHAHFKQNPLFENHISKEFSLEEKFVPDKDWPKRT
jgi:hypothetical protein